MKTLVLLLVLLTTQYAFGVDTCHSLFVSAKADITQSDSFSNSIQQLQVSSLNMEQIRREYESKHVLNRKANRYEDEDSLQDAVKAVKGQIHAIKRLAGSLRQLAITENALVVGVGGSPSVVIAMLQSMNIPSVNLPLSVPYLPIGVTVGKATAAPKRILNRDQIIEAFVTWEKFLPTPTSLNGRKIIVIDYASTGQSLNYAADMIQAYYLSFGLKVQVDTFGLKDHGVSSIPMNLEETFLASENQNRRMWLYKLPFGLSADFYGHIFKPLAEYPSYVPGLNKPDELRPRRQYQLLLEYFKKWMSADGEKLGS